MFSNSNSNLVNKELAPTELFYHKRIHGIKEFPEIDCSHYSFCKVSIYVGDLSVFKCEFLPSKIQPERTNGVDVARTLVLPTVLHTVVRNEYKFFVFPIEGEKIKITISNLGNDTESYMKVIFSNNFHYCSND